MKRFIGIVIFALCAIFSRTVQAGAWPDYTPLLPMAPQFCLQCLPSTISTVSTTISKAQSTIKNFDGAKMLTMVGQSALSYGLDLGKSKFNSLKQKVTTRKKVVSYSRTIEDSSLTAAGNIEDEGKVKEAFIQLFFQYPSQNGRIKGDYAANGQQFIKDSTLEMYVTAREMNKELRAMLVELDNIEKCLVAGEDCSEEGMEQYNCQKDGSEDKVCLWRNALTAVRIYDKIMRYNEFLTAMNAQYNAVKSINQRAKIKEFKKETKSSAAEEKYFSTPNKYVRFETTVTMSAASAEIDDSKFDTLNDAGLESPVEGKEDEFNSLEIIAQAKEKMNEAVLAHNYKQSLPDYLNVFKTYHETEAYYQKTKENAVKSTRCAISYLNNFFEDANKAWWGKECRLLGNRIECGTNAKDIKNNALFYKTCSSNKNERCFVADYFTAETGFGGWLWKLYNTAKDEAAASGEDTYTSETEENGKENEDSTYMPSVVDTSVNGVSSLDNMKSNANKGYAQDTQGRNVQVYKKPSIEEDMYKEARANGLMNWSLGAEASRRVTMDALSGKSDFGKTRNVNVVWNDEKLFYDEYLNGKYENMKTYISNMMLLQPLVTIGLQQVKEGEYSQKEKSAYTKSLNKLLSFVNQLPSTEEIDNLLQAEKETFETLTKNYETQVADLRKQKALIYASMDETSSKISEIKDKLNQANETISQADDDTPKSEDALDYGKKLEREDVETTSLQQSSFQTNIKDNETNKEKADTAKTGLEENLKSLSSKLSSYRNELDKIDQAVYQAQADYVKAYHEAELAQTTAIDTAVKNYNKKMQNYRELVEAAVAENPIALAIWQSIKLKQQDAIAKIETAAKSIKDLGKEIYTAKGGEKMVNIHQQLLRDLKNIDLSENVKGIYSEVTENTAANDEYFVGIVARKSDFQTPKTLISASAPLREIFHFDMDDYDTVLKSFKDGITKLPKSNENVLLVGNSLLKSGLDLPDIWKKILKNRQYVEKKMDLSKLLVPAQNGSELAEVISYIELPKIISMGLNGEPITEMIGQLTFNQKLQEAVYTINDSDKIGEDKDADALYYAMSARMFDRNLFGDYLDNNELFNNAADALSEQGIQVSDLRKSLNEIFNKLGYSLSDDFDLMNPSDYKKAEEKLKEYKTGNLTRLKELTNSINGTSEIVIENKEKLLHGIEVLEKDNEETTQITAEDDLDELDEKIKNAKADKKVMDVYEKAGTSAMSNAISKLREPYCAVYY